MTSVSLPTFLVLTNPPEKFEDGHFDSDTFELVSSSAYCRTWHDGMFFYQVGEIIPLIEENTCTALVYIKEVGHHLGIYNKPLTVIDYEVISSYPSNHPVGLHYTDLYMAFLKKETFHKENRTFKAEDYKNMLNRRSFEKQLEAIQSDKNS